MAEPKTATVIPAEDLRRAAELRADAREDDRHATEIGGRNPELADYLRRRAKWRRVVASDLDGGAEQRLIGARPIRGHAPQTHAAEGIQVLQG